MLYIPSAAVWSHTAVRDEVLLPSLAQDLQVFNSLEGATTTHAENETTLCSSGRLQALGCACWRGGCPKASGAKKRDRSDGVPMSADFNARAGCRAAVGMGMGAKVGVRCLSPTLLSLPTGNLHLNRSLLNLCAQYVLLGCLGLETIFSFFYISTLGLTDFTWLRQFIPAKDLNCSFQVWLFKIKCF